MANIGIIGAGSWGTALGILLVNNGHKTTLWSHRQEQAEELDRTREHREKLPGVRLPEALEITNDLEKTLVGKDILIMAITFCGGAADSQKDQAFYTIRTAYCKCGQGN